MYAGDGECFVSWEEQIMCGDRGGRLVHFYLKKASGESMLSVIGTERSIRHMLYVGTDELRLVCGNHRLIKSSLRWRAKREAVDFLNSLVSDSRMEDSAQCFTSVKKLATRKLRSSNEEIKWSGEACFCTKQLKHYSTFCRNNITVAVHSFVFIMAEFDEHEEGHYLGYIVDMHEDMIGLKKVQVRWFYLTQEICHMFPQYNPHPHEAFITPQVEVISADCVEGPVTVLSLQHYEAFSAANLQVVPPAEILMCYRQIENSRIQPFSLFNLHGYLKQEVVSLLNLSLETRSKIKGNNGNGANDIEVSCVNHALSGGPRSQVVKHVQPKLILNMSKSMAGINIDGSKYRSSSLFRINGKIELLCQDSGIRGCWFRCQILKISFQKMKVRYEDVLDIDDSAKLEEWVPTSRVANPDRHYMRCPGRKTIRPWPPKEHTTCSFEIGSAVDTWWCDGWWEGVVIGDIPKLDQMQVYLTGEEKILSLDRRYLRNSRDWIDNRWVEIKPKPEIAYLIFSKGLQIPKLIPDSGSCNLEKQLGPRDNRVSTPHINDSMEVEQEILGQTDPYKLLEGSASSHCDGDNA
ncbi:hypothetical protein SAY87_021173 [Trapa incisa]|uniref:BAH domain-containing protein n=1 Tax=Trapa incisa TaxID=236973 RepID=A0AAN7PVH9_9MYRT|nr:hypothetical protein SAY87_021173 [Trapa incisa]